MRSRGAWVNPDGSARLGEIMHATGPTFGLLLWQAKRPRVAEKRVALTGNRLLYGLVLSEIRRRPQR